MTRSAVTLLFQVEPHWRSSSWLSSSFGTKMKIPFLSRLLTKESPVKAETNPFADWPIGSLALVSKFCIGPSRKKVRYLKRDAPRFPQDSGWMLFSGDGAQPLNPADFVPTAVRAFLVMMLHSSGRSPQRSEASGHDASSKMYGCVLSVTILSTMKVSWSARPDDERAEQTRCSEPGDDALFGNRNSVAPGH